MERPVIPPEKKEAPAKVVMILFGMVAAFVLLIAAIGWIIVFRS